MQRLRLGGIFLLGLSYSSKFLRNTAPEGVGAVLTASTNEQFGLTSEFWNHPCHVLIMEPVSLELNVIRAGHNSETDVALTLTVHRTSMNCICDAAFVGMGAPELPESFVGFERFVPKKLSLSGKLHHLTH